MEYLVILLHQGADGRYLDEATVVRERIPSGLLTVILADKLGDLELVNLGALFELLQIELLVKIINLLAASKSGLASISVQYRCDVPESEIYLGERVVLLVSQLQWHLNGQYCGFCVGWRR